MGVRKNLSRGDRVQHYLGIDRVLEAKNSQQFKQN